MAKRITPEQITAMQSLYSKIGTYSGVAKELGISATTVSKYLKEQQTINAVTIMRPYEGPTPTMPEKTLILTYANLTDDEIISYNKWVGEYK